MATNPETHSAPQESPRSGPAPELCLNPHTRSRLWKQTIDAIETYIEGVDGMRVAPQVDAHELRAALARFTFEEPTSPEDSVSFAVDELFKHQIHTSHPRYVGMFNPAPTTMGIAADALVAALNPQLAARCSSRLPWPVGTGIASWCAVTSSWANCSGRSCKSPGGESSTRRSCRLHASSTLQQRKDRRRLIFVQLLSTWWHPGTPGSFPSA
jgi:hypothetical protein